MHNSRRQGSLSMFKPLSHQSSKIVEQRAFDLRTSNLPPHESFLNECASWKVSRDRPSSSVLPTLNAQKKKLAQEEAVVIDDWSHRSYNNRKSDENLPIPSTRSLRNIVAPKRPNTVKPRTSRSNRSPVSSSSIRDYLAAQVDRGEDLPMKYASWTPGTDESTRRLSEKNLRADSAQTKSMPARSPGASASAQLSHVGFRDKLLGRVRKSSALASIGGGNDMPALSPPGVLSRNMSRNSLDGGNKPRPSSRDQLSEEAWFGDALEHALEKGAEKAKDTGFDKDKNQASGLTDMTKKLAEWSGCAKKPVEVLEAELQILFALAKGNGSVVVTKPPP
eukprot:2370345-Rhodomonas_salina.1